MTLAKINKTRVEDGC